MPRRRSDAQAALAALEAFRRLPPRGQVMLGVVLAVGVAVYLFATWRASRLAPAVTAPPPADAGGYLFCFWNVENLFDDKVDPGRRAVDQPFDRGFGDNPALLQEKLDRIASAVLRLNGGRGPDVLAFAEVESVRAADLLRGTLNGKLQAAGADPKLQYTQLAMKNMGNDAGRHIGTGVLTRLPVAHIRTKLHGRNLRILEAHVQADGRDLTVIASHWTSQLRQRDGSDGDAGRDRYARTIYDVYKAAADRDRAVDVLACGDFNCPPDDGSVTDVLGAFGDRAKLAGPPAFLNLLAGKDSARYGTIWYSGKPLVYDQICVSPGLLDGQGWVCDPASVRVETEGLIRPGATRREPWRFGDPERGPVGERGYSDHFPVTVRLTVQTARE